MATASKNLIGALRRTAKKLEKTDNYQWGHMGACNCGFLAQEITHLSKDEIHEYAMRKSGDWAEQVNDYCARSGYHIDLLINVLLQSGITKEDLVHLERLSDQTILQTIPLDQRYLHHNKKEDVILYINAWANLLEKQLQHVPQMQEA